MKKRWMKLTAMGLSAAALLAFSGPPVFAAASQTPVQGPQITMEKYLVMDSQANVPNVTFSFGIAPASGDELKPKDENDATTTVLAGETGAVIGTAVFSVGQTTYTSPQKLTYQGSQNGQSTPFEDDVTLAAGQKYARSEVSIDLGGVTFEEPGVYRYKITENDATDGVQGISNDENAVRYLDVYVNADDAGVLSIAGTVLHTGADAVQADGTDPDGKNDGFENTYETEDLTISKEVAGNQASRDRYFPFTVTISGAVAGTVYEVAGEFDEETAVNRESPESHANPASLTAGTDGSVTQVFYLQNGQYITIRGLAKDTAYSVEEDEYDYIPSVTAEGDTQHTVSERQDKVEDPAITADTTLAFVNTREGIVPTGLMMAVGPYAFVTLAGSAGLAAMMMRRKKRGGRE